MLAIDLFCGLGGWTDGLLAEGYEVVGFDVERHEYGEHRYPAQLVLQDVLTLDGAQFADAQLIVASPPCQEYSYMAMPWTRAKQIRAALIHEMYSDVVGYEKPFPEGYTGSRTVEELNALFNACFRIQREACAAAGKHIPLVVENVRGAQEWVGRARWNYGSYYLWGDVPALMPMAQAVKNPGFRFDGSGSFQSEDVRGHVDAIKNSGGSDGRKQGGDWFSDSSPGTLRSFTGTTGRKVPGNEFGDKGFNVAAAERYGGMIEGAKYKRTEADKRQHIGAKRKFASAMIAKIPLPLSRHIAAVYRALMVPAD